MRTVIGLFDSRREAKRTSDDLRKIGASNISMVSQDGTGSGPLAAYLDRGSAGDDTSGILRALVGMGLSESEAERYVSGVRSGYTLETATVEDDLADEALAIMNQHVIAQGNGSPRGGEAGREAAGETVLPVIVEELRVGKREVGAGGVRVTETVEEIPLEEQVTLREERVDVERRAVDRPVSAADDAFRDRTFEVTATSEEAVVEKDARVVEEVVVRKGETSRTETIRDTVRKTDVNIEQLSSQYKGHFDQSYGSQGGRFEEWAPAYQYGSELRGSATDADRDWSKVEPRARSDWEKQSPGTWERVKDAIKHAFQS